MRSVFFLLNVFADSICNFNYTFSFFENGSRLDEVTQFSFWCPLLQVMAITFVLHLVTLSQHYNGCSYKICYKVSLPLSFSACVWALFLKICFNLLQKSHINTIAWIRMLSSILQWSQNLWIKWRNLKRSLRKLQQIENNISSAVIQEQGKFQCLCGL